MKTMKIRTLVSLAAAAMTLSAAAADQTLCPSTAPYSIKDADAASTFTWTVEGGTAGTDYTLTVNTPTSSSSVVWVKPGDYTLSSQETNQYNCKGPVKTISIKVSNFASPADINEDACSYTDGVESGVIGLTLPVADAAGNTIGKWVVTAMTIPAGVTAHSSKVGTLPFEITTSTFLSSDSFVNTNSTPADVVYTITPYTGDCPGTPFTATVKVYPVVVVPTIIF